MKLRLFVGIPLPPETVASLRRAQNLVRSKDASWAGEKWLAPENLHVTLSFFGDVDETLVPPLVSALGEAVALATPPTLTPTALAAVPDPRRCRMLWAAFHDADDATASLVRAIRDRAVPLGIHSDDKPFKPHATLCRARHPHSIDSAALALAEQEFLGRTHAMSDPAITLFSSRLTPRGPHYSEIATWHVLGDCHL